MNNVSLYKGRKECSDTHPCPNSMDVYQNTRPFDTEHLMKIDGFDVSLAYLSRDTSLRSILVGKIIITDHNHHNPACPGPLPSGTCPEPSGKCLEGMLKVPLHGS